MSINSVPNTLVVVPVYNHAEIIRQVVRTALDLGWPVLVVDDGSDDGVHKALAGLDCPVHTHDRNYGKGAAILTGAKIAREQGYEAIATIDADGQLEPRDLRHLVKAAGGNWPSMVIGARRMDRDNAPAASLFGRSFSNFWVKLECGLDLPDTQSGMRLYPVEELYRLQIKSRRYDFEVEVVAKAAWAGLPIMSVPVSVHYPEASERQSHFHQLKDNFRLTKLHTGLIVRRLLPLPHERVVAETEQQKEQRKLQRLSLLHPIKLLKQLCREHTSTMQLAVAAWVGIFLGALPLIASHTVITIYVTHRLHLNKLAALSASQICMPPVVPVLCIQLGYFMRYGEFLWEISWDTMVLEAHLRLWEWLLGSLVIGPLLGFIGGAIVYAVLRKLRLSGYDACRTMENG